MKLYQTKRLEEMVEFTNTYVFERLHVHKLLPKKTKDGKEMMKKAEVLSANQMQRLVRSNMAIADGTELRLALEPLIQTKYDVEDDAAATIAKETTYKVVSWFPEQTPLEIAFTQIEYIGEARSKFKEYLETCWEMHCTDSKSLRAPLVAVVQSSGFGKSRLVFELARMALEPSSKMKVLYVCARTRESSGYPKTTPLLRDWLFSAECTRATLATQLEVIFQYAVDNWETVQDEWLKLFTSIAVDSDVTSKQKICKKKMSLEKKTNHKQFRVEKW